ncbi:MAG: hypothetical protein ACYDDP_07290 [Acidithiobacillus sp.]
MKAPSEVLAETILPLLASGRLFLPEDAEKYSAKLATGDMKAEDWLLAVEKALEKAGTQ